MQILKAYKFRLEPTEQQAQRLRQLGGCARYVWNHGLAETKRILDAGEKLPSAFELNRMLTSWKKDPEMAFLAEAYTDNLQQKLKDLGHDLRHRACAIAALEDLPRALVELDHALRVQQHVATLGGLELQAETAADARHLRQDGDAHEGDSDAVRAAHPTWDAGLAGGAS